ncbi:HlyC/CorC family transporter [Agaribacterium haliotis]|uniref:HlyC/CorC family transporter n=1 Tax=Agaribacterium haliotis TaxID=2013869 RepID=UPI000BB53690|nr:transporter associated domain-containing protein [Agaribacterium haliotis]
MNDEAAPSQSEDSDSRPWLSRLFSGRGHIPRNRQELLSVIKHAASSELLDEEVLHIIEGAIDVAHQQVREIMIAKAQMVCIQIDETPEQFLPKVIESGHSRFPVVGESGDDVKGILLAKDLLPLLLKGVENFDLEKHLRPANVIPESKRLNILLKEFRENRYHMAMVIDEYGGISGLITIEDILEEIVGEIEDETDDDNEDFIRQVADNDYILKALTPIDDFNRHFKAKLDTSDFDTIGGLATQAFGHVPKRNETTHIGGFSFRVLYADDRKIHLLRVSRLDTEQ